MSPPYYDSGSIKTKAVNAVIYSSNFLIFVKKCHCKRCVQIPTNEIFRLKIDVISFPKLWSDLSVTRFCKTLPLWQFLKDLGNIFECASSIWQNLKARYEPTLATPTQCNQIWRNFEGMKGWELSVTRLDEISRLRQVLKAYSVFG